VGPRGWLGVRLDRGLSWTRIAAVVRAAYENTAPRALVDTMGKTIAIKPPKATLAPEQLDPMQSARAQRVLGPLRKVCLALPETSEGKQFGSPVWLAGKKSFAIAYFSGAQLTLGFWVGVDKQGMYTNDPRYKIPPYMGHNGWIALNVDQSCNWDEVRELAAQSYRHFALKRMLAKLGD
jgi:predicted DNA-binding protein (MmcQ/YjbR family)